MERYGNENPGAFQSTRPLRGVTSQPITKVELLGEFQPTRPLRGATAGSGGGAAQRRISTHAPLAGRDRVGAAVVALYPISTHAPLAGRDDKLKALSLHADISTHAPLAGRDSRIRWWSCPTQNFNPRAPCGARRKIIRGLQGGEEISTHAPLAGRDEELVSFWSDMLGSISTHAPLAGRDKVDVCSQLIRIRFQPTRPLRGATIAAAHGGNWIITDFNPRAPCGARRYSVSTASEPSLFQPTRPLRGATAKLKIAGVEYGISTHAPLAGRDHAGPLNRHYHKDFNPRAPCGARRRALRSQTSIRNFNPRAPCGARPQVLLDVMQRTIFQPTRPLRGATPWSNLWAWLERFQPTRPLRGATVKVYKSLCTFLR